VGALVAVGLVGALSLSLLLGQWSGGGRRSVLSTPQGGGPIDIAARTFDHTPDVLGILLVTIAAVLLLKAQYLSRHVRRSVGIGLTAVFIAVGVAALWPWPIFVPRQTVPEWANASRAATLAGDPTTFRFDWSGIRNADDVHMARTDASVTGVPDGWFATARLAGASLAVPGHENLASSAYGPAAFLVQPNGLSLLALALKHALGVNLIDGAGTAGADRIVAFVAREAELTARQPGLGSYAGTFVIDLTRFDRVAALSLTPGTFQDGDFRMQLKEVRTELDDEGLFLRTKTSESRTIFDRRPPVAYLYFLVNYDRSQALTGYVSSRSVSGFSLLSGLPAYWFPPGFNLRTTSMRFSVPRTVGDGNRREFVAGWIENARLVVIRATGVGAVTRELQLPDVKTAVDPPKRRQ